MPEFHYTVDGRPQVTSEVELTAAQILRNAGLDPGINYLIEVRSDRRESYHDQPHQAIHLHQHQEFETRHHTVHYYVDDELESTTEHQLTAKTILREAELDPDTHYLVRVDGHHRHSYRDEPDREIELRQQMRFISVSLGPTPVS